MRAATLWDEPLTVVCCISIPAAYAGCDFKRSSRLLDDKISIPAAYAGCDAEVEMTARLRPDFNLYSLG